MPLIEPAAPDLTVVLTLMPSPPGKPVRSWSGTAWPLRISAWHRAAGDGVPAGQQLLRRNGRRFLAGP